MVYFFTGDGKGKTSACLGVTVRALLLDWNVCWISFFKEPEWNMSEMKLPDKFKNLEMYFCGRGFFIKDKEGVNEIVLKSRKIKEVEVYNSKVYDHAKEEEHKQSALQALGLADQKINRVRLLVLDEVANAVEEGLLPISELKRLLDKRGETHVVLSGRGDLSEIGEAIDLISEVKKIKHPFDDGKFAIKGLDF